ncbi:LEAF RUST 10 DISEASE-RESISTANCE LOCUS RECEPTOR-LIKE PROTEIN KINASE-like 2.7 [Mangifera indica]|uniref:LEAF RUST 10 DISEASE-RESISTANCE LOCUS RECEPTOR-LIKE PROTEIN KINASE-like 2.7 n=1 Tax=Mangifera indica TaxID=29780 RepID=UPI001CF9FDED|nr:LEAF RUST 10 DISEASE-RESISTANCE LOCUS RECEPTOR-LIKE PROTEIN KINASE-like 2.7 [Mangifera indica]
MALMSFRHFLWSPLVPLIYFTVVIPVKIQSLRYGDCNIPIRCGNLTAGYPFWGVDRPSGCGHPDLQIFCENDKPIMKMNDLFYLVLNVDEKARILRIARDDYLGGICSPRFINTTLNPALFKYTNEYQMLTLLYACPNSTSLSGHFTCSFTGTNKKDGYIDIGGKGPEACDAGVNVPFPRSLILPATENRSVLEQAFRDGFQVKWNVNITFCEKCIESQGYCSHDDYFDEAICFCRNGQFSRSEACNISLSNQGSSESPAPGANGRF